MRRAVASWTHLLAALAAAACGTAPAPAPSAPAPEVDQRAAERAADVALVALSRRNFDVDGCSAPAAHVAPEAEARAGAAAGEGCSVVVARKADGAWLVVVGSRASSKSVGVRALVTVTAGAEGVSAVEYAR